ncbi:digestive cysteine proteinase 1 [Planococcus citri]|uniref:digestive cysteine proteinase 1 n=1 Tax=Planococcus citri TaxID=170843 RepID=UPI0031F7320F
MLKKLSAIMLKYFGILAILLISGSTSYEESQAPPVFPSSYVAKAVLYIPYSEIEEPFYAWYDADNSVSRVDYYGGMVKTYQLTKQGSYGTMLKIAPITTEDETNAVTCLQVNGSAEIGVISPQNVLPDLKSYELIGTEIIRGIEAEKWQFTEKDGQKLTKYTMFIQYQKSTKDPNVQIPVPVTFIMKGMNVIFGSHFDHYWIDYGYFSDEKPDPSVFQVTDMKCQSFPGPGIDHVYTFNPIREFVEGYDEHVDFAFDKFKRAHNKEYDDKEHPYRREAFKHNVRFIQSKNRANLGYSLGVNVLADKTPTELRALRGRRYSAGYNGGQPFPYDADKEIQSAPDNFDWRIYGAVTPVKDQSVCGSCWSFGTTGAIEGEYFVHTKGTLLRLSQQALIDCSWGYGNNGCDGGEDFRAYQWMLKHGGIPTEEEYGPYYGQDGYCHVQNVTLQAKITGYVNVTSGSEEALKVALLKHGPISVAIDASHRTFSFYSNGVYYEPKCGNTPDGLDHAVLLVGYGTLGDKKYWLIKNSWSNYWGNDGYVLMAIQDNNCGVMTDPTYVTF